MSKTAPRPDGSRATTQVSSCSLRYEPGGATLDSTNPATSAQGTHSADEPMPVGAWVLLFVPQQPEIIGFTYLDREAGLSAKGGPAGDPHLAERPAITVRLPGFSRQPQRWANRKASRRLQPCRI